MKDLIAALAVLASATSSDDEKAAALEKLTAYFNSQLDAEEAKPEAASELADGEKPEGDSGSTEDEEKKEMSSALAAANEQIKALGERMGKLEKASAIGLRPRATKVAVVQREAAPAMDPHAAVTISQIEKAAANTIRMLGK